MLTAKYHRMLAEAIGSVPDISPTQKALVAQHVGRRLAQDNPRFRMNLFLTAVRSEAAKQKGS